MPPVQYRGGSDGACPFKVSAQWGAAELSRASWRALERGTAETDGVASHPGTSQLKLTRAVCSTCVSRQTPRLFSLLRLTPSAFTASRSSNGSGPTPRSPKPSKSTYTPYDLHRAVTVVRATATTLNTVSVTTRRIYLFHPRPRRLCGANGKYRSTEGPWFDEDLPSLPNERKGTASGLGPRAAAACTCDMAVSSNFERNAHGARGQVTCPFAFYDNRSPQSRAHYNNAFTTTTQ